MTAVAHPPHKEGSREHVIWWTGGLNPSTGLWESHRHCSEPRCEVNEQNGRRMSLPKPEKENPAALLAEMQATFDLRWAADMRAIRRWQEAHPGNELVWPDHADMVVRLLEELDRMRQPGRPTEAGKRLVEWLVHDPMTTVESLDVATEVAAIEAEAREQVRPVVEDLETERDMEHAYRLDVAADLAAVIEERVRVVYAERGDRYVPMHDILAIIRKAAGVGGQHGA